ncbi:RES domain-containing protein [Antrihabitans spumae]|uniref:RES domain-containing protein n=1 Tax=Antrihabitans spumae TaxID=3373370 RepID=A0ABW7KXZ1_9NOCA
MTAQTYGVDAVCATTGLNLVPSSGRRMFRVAQTQFGPLQPPPRVKTANPVTWSRWDTPGRTIYGSSTAEGAFVEVLEYITPDPPAVAMSDLFDDVEDSDDLTFDSQIQRELPLCGAMAPRSISKGWREARNLYELVLPGNGWFVDVTGAGSISAVEEQLQMLLTTCGVDRLTLSELTSSSEDMKQLTTGIATWLRESVVLSDGSRPHGVVYPSKWGTTVQNWAMWLRRADDGTGGDAVWIHEASDIGRHTQPFVEVATNRRMRTY